MHAPSTHRLATASVLILLAALLAAAPAAASSHREAPAILEMPEVDGTDFYMFRSYESGREGYVTFLANYNPLQDPFAAPNYFPLRENAFYDIHVDQDGDAVEDLTFRFRFSNALPVLVPGIPGLGVPVPFPSGAFVPVAISNVAPFGPGTPPAPPGGALNWIRTYTVRLLRGPAGNPGQVSFLSAAGNGQRFAMPFDYIGTRSIPEYEAYAQQFIYDVDIPGCGDGRLFVGQRKESFAMNLGDFFDLVHIPNPVGPRAAEPSSFAEKNVTSIALEVPISCLTGGGDEIVAGWTTASLPRVRTLVDDPTFDRPYVESGNLVQVSRVGNPMVNQASIGLKDKNLFNASHPADDEQFLIYFTNPTVPVGIEIVTMVFPPPVGTVQPPTNIPRDDLVAFYLQGLPSLNRDASGGEVVRLNTSIPPTPPAEQSNLGLLGGDLAGFPNGRRPGDDVVDITIRVLEGALCYQGFGFCSPEDAPFGAAPFTDQTWVDASDFAQAFPYLETPLPGSAELARDFRANLVGAGGTTAACTALLPPQQDPFAPPPNPAGLAIVCTHDLPGVGTAVLRQGAAGPVVCSLGNPASPIQAVCPLDPAQLELLQQGALNVDLGGVTAPLR